MDVRGDGSQQIDTRISFDKTMNNTVTNLSIDKKYKTLIQVGVFLSIVGILTMGIGFFIGPPYILSIGAFGTFIGGLLWMTGLYEKARVYL